VAENSAVYASYVNRIVHFNPLLNLLQNKSVGLGKKRYTGKEVDGKLQGGGRFNGSDMNWFIKSIATYSIKKLVNRPRTPTASSTKCSKSIAFLKLVRPYAVTCDSLAGAMIQANVVHVIHKDNCPQNFADSRRQRDGARAPDVFISRADRYSGGSSWQSE
jgi:hypothetical protein